MSTVTAILSAITALGGIFATVKYWGQIVLWFTTKSQSQQNETIATQEQQNQTTEQETGRPS